MYNFLSRYGQLIGLGLGAVIILIYIIIIATSGSSFAEVDGMSSREAAQILSTKSIFNWGVFISIALIILAFLAMLGFGIFQIIQNPKDSMKSLIGVGALLVVFIIAWAISGGDGEVVQAAIDKSNTDLGVTSPDDDFNWITAGTSKLISGGLMTTGVLVVLAFVGLVASEVMNLFR